MAQRTASLLINIQEHAPSWKEKHQLQPSMRLLKTNYSTSNMRLLYLGPYIVTTHPLFGCIM